MTPIEILQEMIQEEIDILNQLSREGFGNGSIDIQAHLHSKMVLGKSLDRIKKETIPTIDLSVIDDFYEENKEAENSEMILELKDRLLSKK